MTIDSSSAGKLLATGTSQDYSFPVQQNGSQEAASFPLITELKAGLQPFQPPQPALPKMLEATYGSSSKYHQSQSRLRRLAKAANEQTLINDYIANIVDQDLNPGIPFNQRDLGEVETNNWQETNPSSEYQKRSPISHWDRSELRDLDDLSTSDEVLGSLEAILSKRQRQSGLQYLVVWENHSMDEARWIPKSSLRDPTSAKLIEEFEAEEELVSRRFIGDWGSNDSSSDEGSNDDEDIVDDDDDIMRQKVDQMTDEKIARLPAKQEELNMGSTAVMLNDGSVGIDGEGDDCACDKDMAVLDTPRRNPHPRGKRGVKRSGCKFPNATALADAYDGFDVIDFDRPSLKKKAKGRKGKPMFDISDSELDASMKVAWGKDRSRKKKRKEERENLRSQGFLSNKDNKEDLEAKYKEGMSIHAVKDELKKFLMGVNTT
jgi:hypothetical protein